MKNIKLLIVPLALLIYSCANQKMPTGGARDTIEPFVVSSIPADSSTMYIGKIIKIIFSENIESNTKQGAGFIISPPNPFSVNIKNKTATLVFKTPLKSNATYSIITNKAVKDLTEGNESKNETLLFSTGTEFDTFSISGSVSIVKDQQTNMLRVALFPKKNWPVLDSIVPEYFTTVNEKGEFNFSNIKPLDYDVVLLTSTLNTYFWNKVSPIGIYQSTATNTSLLKIHPFEPYPIRKNKKEAVYFTEQNLLAIPIEQNLLKYTNVLINKVLYDKNIYLNDTLWLPVTPENAKNIVLTAFGDTQFLSTPKTFTKTSPFYCERIDNQLIIRHKKQNKFQMDSFLKNNPYLDPSIQTIKNNTEAIYFTIKPLYKDSSVTINVKTSSFDYGSPFDEKNIRLNPNPITSIKINLEFKSSHPSYFVLYEKNNIQIEPIKNGTTTLSFKLPKGDYTYFIFEDTDKNNLPTPGSWTSKIIPDPIYKAIKPISVKTTWDLDINLSAVDFN